MDVFYDRRREHFNATKEQQKENLKKKQELLEKLRTLGQHEDPIKAVDEAKQLQSEFKKIGYVPIKKKNETWKQYRETCDVIYDRMRAAKSGNMFDQELAKANLGAEQRSKIQDLRKKHKKINKKVKGLKEEVLQLEESKTNFNFSDEDNPLLKEMQENINKARAELESKQNELDALSMEMEDIREL
jgi:DNA repair exonuclease SbcCD ATPase subunit